MELIEHLGGVEPWPIQPNGANVEMLKHINKAYRVVVVRVR